MPNRFRNLALTGMLTAALAGGAAFAQDSSPQQAPPPPPPGTMQSSAMQAGPGGRHHHMMSPDRQLKHLTKKLNLSADQKSQIKPILESCQQQIQQLRQDQSTTGPDRRAKMKSINEDTHSKIEAVLNDTQKQQFQQMMQNKMQRGHHKGMQQAPVPPDQGGAPPPPAPQQ